MKRLAFCLILLSCPGCMLADDCMLEETVWYDLPAIECGVYQTAPPSCPAPIAPAPRVVPLGPNIVPAGGAFAPPPAAQTREPELSVR